LTDWLSRPAAEGLASRPIHSRSAMCSSAQIAPRLGTDNQVGYDAGKQVKGRKIHALVDSEGLPMRVVVHSAVI